MAFCQYEMAEFLPLIFGFLRVWVRSWPSSGSAVYLSFVLQRFMSVG